MRNTNDQNQPRIRRRPSTTLTQKQTPSHLGTSRNIEAILARQNERMTRDYTTFAPGMSHGNFDFTEIYQLDLSSWFEQCVFVNQLISVSGRVLGYAVAHIDEGFVTVHHHLVQDISVARQWLSQHTQHARTVVELQTTTYEGVTGFDASVFAEDATMQGYIPMRCDMYHLMEMERTHLRLQRDHSTFAVHTLDPTALAIMLENNVLSLMSLCCRLLINPAQNDSDDRMH